MISGNLERAQTDNEVYIAWNARILDAMKKAAGGLVGTVVEVIPAGDKEFSPAAEAAKESGRRLYEQSGERYLDPEYRHESAQISIEDHDGGVVTVGFDPQRDSESQRDIFHARTVRYLLHQVESFDEGSYTDPNRVETKDDLRHILHMSGLNARRAQEYLDRLGGVHFAEDAIGSDKVKSLEGTVDHYRLVRDAMEASDEIDTVNKASLGKYK